MIYLNQLDYPHIPYYTRVKKDIPREEMLRSVAKSRYGLCCISMAVESETKPNRIKYHILARRQG